MTLNCLYFGAAVGWEARHFSTMDVWAMEDADGARLQVWWLPCMLQFREGTTMLSMLHGKFSGVGLILRRQLNGLGDKVGHGNSCAAQVSGLTVFVLCYFIFTPGWKRQHPHLIREKNISLQQGPIELLAAATIE